MKRLDAHTQPLFPLGLRIIAIGIAIALLRGGTVFVWAEDASNPQVADFAVSYALITLFSVVFGVWLAVGLSRLAIHAFLYALNGLKKRGDKLIRRVEEFYNMPLDRDGSGRSASGIPIVAIGSYGYIVGFTLAGITLGYATLHSYTYEGSPLAIAFDSDLILQLRYVYAVGLLSFVIAIGALLTISARIALHWNNLIRFENEFDTLESSARAIQEFAPASASLSESIIKANANAMRLLAAGRT